MAASRRVLVLGDDTRSFLATVRSLGRAKLEVHAAPFNFRSAALTSRYIKKLHWLPYYLGSGEAWLAAMEKLLTREAFDLVIPCDERTLLPLDLHRAKLSAHARLALPDPHSLEVFFDKNNTRELARALDISIAEGRAIHSTDRANDLIAAAGLPLAVKPSASYTIEHLYARNKVVIVTDEPTLDRTLAAIAGEPHFFEAYFPGRGVGISVLAHKGRILQAFEHHRVHELQGSSYYRVSCELSPPLLDAVIKMIAHVGYTGVAMFEFRVNDESKRWILLEVNARPWGSLPLPIAVGADFPYRWYQLLVDGAETAPEQYRVGTYGRNLIPDAHYVASEAKRLRRHPLKLAGFLARSASEYARILTRREIEDVWVSDDLRPGWRELVDQLATAKGHLISALPGSAGLASRHERRLVRQALQRSEKRRFTIAFVCQGNICRSPFAAALLRREIEWPKIQIRSYGNLPRSGARPPANAIAAAKARSVNLEAHRSKHFAPDSAERADLILVFDAINRRWIEERYPEIAAPVVMLGSFSPRGASNRTIPDPDGGDLAQFDETYDAIAAAVAGLARHIREAHGG
jgi:protein-tyrosine-phosphatase/predicted ATP-grasp superfamily ATP-dependent carboligase